MRARAASLPLLLLPLACGAAVPLLAAGGGLLPLGASGALLLVLAFVAFPWAVLPTAIVGATAASVVAGLSSVTPIVAVHGAVLGAGLLALAIRRLIVAGDLRQPTRADLPMATLAAVAGLGCVYGLAAGHAGHAVLVAGYEIGVIPAYYWFATVTLGDERARQRAMVLFLAGAVALAAAGLGSSGRHGGLLSALALIPALLAASRETRPTARLALLCCAALLGVDVVLAAYRAIWLAAGVATLIVVWRGPRQARVTLLSISGLAGVVALASLLLSHAGAARLGVVSSELHASAGYRLPEAAVGLRAFLGTPLLGAGMGQVTPAVWIPGFRIANVGPVYHVFYVTLLANGGALLALAFLASMVPALMALRRRGGRDALPWAALLAGFLLAAAFSAPTDGHWELGLLPALALMEASALRSRRIGTPASPVTNGGSASRTAAPHRRASAAPAPLPALQPGIHAVVVAYHSRDQIDACLPSLVRSVDHVVVVDNASGDGTAELVTERFPSAAVIANRENVGFAAAVNQGLQGLKHDTVLLVNPDCTLDRATPAQLRAHLHDHPDVGVVAPRILRPDGQPAVSVHPFETLWSVVSSRFGGSLIPYRLRRLVAGRRRRSTYEVCSTGERPFAVDWASGACLAIRGELIRELGGLDESYFMFYEDEELCVQAAQRGWRVVYLPSAIVTHTGGASSSDPAAVWPSLYASMLVFFGRHRAASVDALRAVLLLRAAVGMTLAALRGRRRSLLAWWRVAGVASAGPRGARGRRP